MKTIDVSIGKSRALDVEQVLSLLGDLNTKLEIGK